MRFRRIIPICICLVVFLAGSSCHSKTTRQYQRDVFIHLDQGSMFLESGQYQAARQEFQKALELDSNCPDAYNNLGLTYYRTGDLTGASKNYMKALEIEPLFVPSLSNLAAVRYQQGKFSDAANLYRLALRLANEKDPQLQYNLANVLRDDKDYSEAEIHYLEAIKLKPDFAAAHNGLGATYYCLSDFDKAEQHINKAISLKKDYALAYYHLGLTLAAKGDAQRAIDAYEASLKFEKNSAYKKDTLAKIAELKGAAAKPNESAASVQKVGGSLDSVTSFMETGKFGKAEALLAAMVATKHSRDASFWNTLGYCQLKQGLPAKVAQSVTNFKKAVELSDGRLIEANYNLANAYKKMGKWMSARKACNAAIDEARRQEKLCPLVHNLHGIILKHSGDLKGAESAYRIAIAQSMGKLPVAHYNRGLVLEKMKKTRDAVKEYKNYLRDAPSGANAARARNHIAALMGS